MPVIVTCASVTYTSNNTNHPATLKNIYDLSFKSTATSLCLSECMSLEIPIQFYIYNAKLQIRKAVEKYHTIASALMMMDL